MRRTRRLVPVFALLVCLSIALLGAGCGDDGSPTAPPAGATWRHLLHGALTDGKSGAAAPVLLDLSATDDAVSGVLMLRPGDLPLDGSHYTLTGRVTGDSLALDNGVAPGTGLDLLLTGAIDGTGAVTAVLSSVNAGLQVRLDAAPLPEIDARLTRRRDIPYLAKACVHHGDALWLSVIAPGHLFDDVALDSAWTAVDTISVYLYPNTHWSGDVLARDDSLFYGNYPVTREVDGVVRSVHDLVAFRDDGEIRRRIPLNHAVRGLAWRDGFLWTLNAGDGVLRRLSPEGAVLDSVTTDLPGGHGLAWNAGWWTQSWNEPLLLRIDTAGRLDGYVRLPGSAAGLNAGGVSAWRRQNRVVAGRALPGGATVLVEIEPVSR